ncbi:hypothetical protein ABT124_03875 [Streptomyces sp. NPDC001982]|uniref:hypothetical protein n=1 Tax=Streptomyces sp. NPDC001982 TaxID=3154405 RepID=UPI003323B9FD
MTQSGQGEPAREGIVLPSDGGEPLLPGMTGGPAPQPVAPAAQPPAAAPTGGQAWGRPWGPGPEQQTSQSDQGWPPAPGDQWGAPEQHVAWNAQSTPGALPPEGAQASYDDRAPHNGSYGTPADAVQSPYGQGAHAGQQPYGQGAHAGQQSYGHDADAGHSTYGHGTHAAPGGADAHQQPYAQGGQSHAAPLPPATEGYAAPATGVYTSDAGAALPPAAHGAALPPGGPLPPAVDNATTYLPSVAADEGATQYIPPVAAAHVDEGATQYIAPVGPGALPPEVSGEETRFLGQMPQAAVPNSDAEATQYMAPVPGAYGGERQPPAEFDNLFRETSAAESPAASTQQMPRFEQPQSPYQGGPQPSYAPPGPGGGRRGAQGGDGGGRGRTGSRMPVIAAVGVGIVVLGIGAGALLSGGGGDGKKDNSKNVAASAPATDQSGSPAADAAKQQAVALDKLLADSGSSRATVIKSVADVKSCKNLPGAAADLRAAAKQRNGLVTRLSQLSVDKLPNNAALTAALTKAWQASASADSHYAAWADQAAGRRGCRKGQARGTGQTLAGDKASYTASSEKAKAAGMWNAIAKTYGLTQRQPTQL